MGNTTFTTTKTTTYTIYDNNGVPIRAIHKIITQKTKMKKEEKKKSNINLFANNKMKYHIVSVVG